jgi:hypothetical protein
MALAGVFAAFGIQLAASSTAAAQGTVTATCTSGGITAPCTGTWYTSPVSVVWQATPAPVSTSGCALGILNRFVSDTVADLSCTATFADNSFASAGFSLHLEVSTPSISATARPPDSAGWYHQPVTIEFDAQSFSGIASCTPPVTYAGPSTPGTSVGGTCVDTAGKTVSTTFPLAYDATPPALSAAALPADRSVALNWSASDIAPITSVTVIRTPGLRHARASTLYTGAAATYHDEKVRNGVRYSYTIIASDQAGNTSTKSIDVTPNPRLLAPLANAHVSSPPLLSWTPVRRASYYNVQLYRSGKVLSAWPKHATFQLRGTWKFDGRRFRLKPGRYTWYVWPGFGKRSAARYGRAIGQGTFVVMRGA